MPEIIRRRVNPNTGEVLGTTYTTSTHVPAEIFTRGQRPFVFDNGTIVEDYFQAELSAYDSAGQKLWERGQADDAPSPGYQFINREHWDYPPTAATTTDGTSLYYIRVQQQDDYPNNYGIRVYTPSLTTGEIIKSNDITTDMNSTHRFAVGGIFSTRDNVVVSAYYGELYSRVVRCYVLSKSDLTVEQVLESEPLDLTSGIEFRESGGVSHLYSPTSNSAIITHPDQSVWVDFEEGVVRGIFGNLATNGLGSLVTTNGLVSRDWIDYGGKTSVLSYSTDSEIDFLPSAYRTLPSGKVGQPMDEGVYEIGNLPMSVPYLPYLPEYYTIVENIIPPGGTDPGTWMVYSHHDLGSGLTYLDGIEIIDGVPDYANWVEFATGTKPPVHSGGGGDMPVINTENYLLVMGRAASGQDSAIAPYYRYEKSTGALTEISFGSTNPRARHRYAHAVDGDTVYLVGFGLSTSSNDTRNESYVVDLVANTVSNMTTPQPNGSPPTTFTIPSITPGTVSGTVVDDTLYIMLDGNEDEKGIYAYDIDTNTWSSRISTPPSYGGGEFYANTPRATGLYRNDGGVLRFLRVYEDYNNPFTFGYLLSTYNIADNSWDTRLLEQGDRLRSVDGFFRLGDGVYLLDTGLLFVDEGAVYPY